MFGRFSREGVSSTRPRWQLVPARRRRLQPASPRGPPRLTPVKPGRERSASAPPAPPGGGTCQAPAPHLGLRSLLLVDPGSGPGRARLPRVRSVRESRRPRVTTAEPRARSAGSWSGAPSAPRAPARSPPRIPLPRRPPRGFRGARRQEPGIQGRCEPGPGPGGSGGAGRPRSERRAAGRRRGSPRGAGAERAAAPRNQVSWLRSPRRRRPAPRAPAAPAAAARAGM